MLSIRDLSVSINETPILTNLSLDIKPGTIHAVMGPNGSGKSTLAHTIAGNPSYEIQQGSMHFEGKNLIACSPAERAQSGIFLSFQQPPAIPGLSVFSLLKEMRRALVQDDVEVRAFHAELQEYLLLLAMDEKFLERSCNDGFSGGEKKRFELLQLLVAQPKLVILDEIDSGLDIDALKLVATVIGRVRTAQPDLMVLIITHYQRLLEYVSPDYVHVLVDGQIKERGDKKVINRLERQGYHGYRTQNQAS
jgi:Fe-S cluster assembly ATP-binding protein